MCRKTKATVEKEKAEYAAEQVKKHEKKVLKKLTAIVGQCSLSTLHDVMQFDGFARRDPSWERCSKEGQEVVSAQFDADSEAVIRFPSQHFLDDGVCVRVQVSEMAHHDNVVNLLRRIANAIERDYRLVEHNAYYDAGEESYGVTIPVQTGDVY